MALIVQESKHTAAIIASSILRSVSTSFGYLLERTSQSLY